MNVYEYIGSPEFRKIGELKPTEISLELDRLNSLLQKGNVSLSTLCSVDDKELYCFITEDK
jgi:hypothetical protein